MYSLADFRGDRWHAPRRDFQRIPQAKLAAAIALVEALARPPEDQYYPEVMARWRQVRLFLPLLLQTITFQANKAGQPFWQRFSFSKPSKASANRH